MRSAIELIASVPGCEATARGLARRRIRIEPNLPDRAQTSLRGTIRLGPEPFAGPPDAVRAGLAGTLVHEYDHTCRNPLLKTVSFWSGVWSRTHPMRRYEEPAYRRQAAFLAALACADPAWRPVALRERQAVIQAFCAVYGPAVFPEAS